MPLYGFTSWAICFYLWFSLDCTAHLFTFRKYPHSFFGKICTSHFLENSVACFSAYYASRFGIYDKLCFLNLSALAVDAPIVC